MTERRRWVIGLAATFVLGVLAAPLTAKDPVRWKHGIVAAKGDAGFQFMALEKKFWAQDGVDVSFVQTEGGSTLFRFLLAGEVDTIEASPPDIFSAVAAGGELKIVGATIPGMSHVLYVKNDVKSVKDLTGKKIGISVPGALPQVLIQALLLENGMPLDSVQWVNAGGDAARVKALLVGTVDAVASTPDWVPMVTKEGTARVLLKFGEALPRYLRFVLITTDKTIKEKPEALTAFLSGYARGIRHAVQNRDETIALTRKTIKAEANDPAPAFIYDTFVRERLLAPNLAVSEDQIAWMQELNLRLGKQKAPVPINRVVDMRFQQQVIARLGPHKW
jgi:NitT/TauT family transport system substrate-binding protein